MTNQSEIARIAAGSVCPKVEYEKFVSWWKRTIPATPVPAATNHTFSAWMASARRQAALLEQEQSR